MSRSAEQMQQKLELMLNEVAANQTVNRIALQCLMMSLTRGRGPEILDDMKRQVMGAIQNTEPAKSDPQGGERRKQLTLMRAESMFQEMEEALGLAGRSRNPSASN